MEKQSLRTLIFLLAAAVCALGYRHHGYHREVTRIKRDTTPCRGENDRNYRRPDGRCNNWKNPEWGSAGSVMPRFKPAVYSNAVDAPTRTGPSGNILPNPRTVSVKAHGPSDASSKVTLMVMQWGQFLDHDLALTPHPDSADCCTSLAPQCFNIPIPPRDEFFLPQRTCMSFARSEQTRVNNVAQQSNAITAFLDASNVYGSSAQKLAELRDPERPHFLKESEYELLPAGPDSSCRNETGEQCFDAGDARVNEQPGLAAMHTIFMREHNRIARKLRNKFRWSSERAFQEARRIVTAEMQHITYNEFLPLVLGPKVMEKFGLRTGDRYRYGKSVDPSIRNEFATAVYRFGHSLIPDEISIRNQILQFQSLFMKPELVINALDDVAAAFRRQKAPEMDRHFSFSVTRHLFETAPRMGHDLVALNVQRGRDHGLQPLNVYREMCGEDPFTSLDQLFPNDRIAQSVYQHIDDVDLFTGGVAESPVDGGLVGPTFACLMAKQFQLLRNGDRFFYLNQKGSQSFTPEQIEEIKKVRLSRVICDNTENNYLQRNVFVPESYYNYKKPCFFLDNINLDKWASDDDQNSIVKTTDSGDDDSGSSSDDDDDDDDRDENRGPPFDFSSLSSFIQQL